jgi:hypothetical protein
MAPRDHYVTEHTFESQEFGKKSAPEREFWIRTVEFRSGHDASAIASSEYGTYLALSP